MQRVLIDGSWRDAKASGSFDAHNPATGQPLTGQYPVSTWADCDAALSAAAGAAAALRQTPPEKLSQFLQLYAARIELRAAELVEMAHLETALPKSPRLADVELPRTTGQMRQAADAALEGSWSLPTIDTKLNIRSYYAPIGPVVVFGPNNFPLAFNSISGGDFVAAIASGNPVIAKAHPCHPGTTRLLAEEAQQAAVDAGLHRAVVQMLYHVDRAEGLRLVGDPRVGAIGYTGSRSAGLALKSAADAAGKPIYLEMSSLNPVVLLPGALAERGATIAEEYAGSLLLGGGQFCTKPGLVLLIAGELAERFIGDVRGHLESRAPGPMLSEAGFHALGDATAALRAAGAQVVTGGHTATGVATPRLANTLLRVTGRQFLAQAGALQTEAFGNAGLVVVTADLAEMQAVTSSLEANLTASIYSATNGADDSFYDALAALVRPRVGRLLNDKMPTGVAVSPAMHHGGPYPATGHPGFTAVGIPASMRRFAMLQCFDNVRQHRLPLILRDQCPPGRAWRLVDGQWVR